MLSGREWLNVVMKGTFNLCCTARVQSGERSNPKRGRKLRRCRFYQRMLAKEHPVLLLCYFILRLHYTRYTIVPRSPFFCFLYSKIFPVTKMWLNVCFNEIALFGLFAALVKGCSSYGRNGGQSTRGDG